LKIFNQGPVNIFTINVRLKISNQRLMKKLQSKSAQNISIRIRLKNFNQGAIQKLLTRVRLKMFHGHRVNALKGKNGSIHEKVMRKK